MAETSIRSSLPALEGSGTAGQALRRAARSWDDRLPWGRLYAGDRFECPCCGGRFRRLRSVGGRPNARCPACGSLERHRTLWLYLVRETDVLHRRLDVLHFAPERPFEHRFAALPEWRYVPADLFPAHPGQRRIDITAIDSPDDSFDLVICNHVLVEVPDDRAAIRELHRVVRPGGVVITQVPLDPRRASTAPTDGEDGPTRRLRGRNLRIYGRDYEDALSAAGFEVERVDYAEQFDRATAERFALDEIGVEAKGNAVFLARKPVAA